MSGKKGSRIIEKNTKVELDGLCKTVVFITPCRESRADDQAILISRCCGGGGVE
jgi:hypothetical protein